MKRIVLLLFLYSISNITYSQSRYIVFFKDKNNSPYSLTNPSAFLSQRAIDRRSNQGIGLDNTDLPVSPTYLSGVSGTGAQLINATKWFNGVTVWATGPQLAAINGLPYVSNVVFAGIISNSPDKKFKEEKFRIPCNPETNSTLRTSGFNYGQSFNHCIPDIVSDGFGLCELWLVDVWEFHGNV